MEDQSWRTGNKQMDEYIQQLMDETPPLTPADIEDLTQILREAVHRPGTTRSRPEMPGDTGAPRARQPGPRLPSET